MGQYTDTKKGKQMYQEFQLAQDAATIARQDYDAVRASGVDDNVEAPFLATWRRAQRAQDAAYTAWMQS